MFIIGSVLTCANEFFGSPIRCDYASSSDVQKDVIESYCWMYATWNIPENFTGINPI